MQAQLAALQGRVAQLEAELAGRGHSRRPGRRQVGTGRCRGAEVETRRTGRATGADRGVLAGYCGQGAGVGGAG